MKRKKVQEEVSTTPRKRARKEASKPPTQNGLGSQASPSHRPNSLHHDNGSKNDDNDDGNHDDEDDDETPDPHANESPGRRRRQQARAPLSTTKSSLVNGTTTPSATRHVNKLETPSRAAAPTPSRRMAADRSARRKSARAMIARVVDDDDSDEAEEDQLNRAIYESSEDEGGRDTEPPTPQKATTQPAPEAAPDTTAATPKRGRGRPKGTGKLQRALRNKSPTPPRDLPPHERYFLSNKPGVAKTSNNTLGNLELLDHDEYFSFINNHPDRHADEIEHLQASHEQSFPQWLFELSEGFSLCLYGYGSKRRLLHRFATYLHEQSQVAEREGEGEREELNPDDDGRKSSRDKIVIVNGYVRNLTLREVLSTISQASNPLAKLPLSTPTAMLSSLLTTLSSSPATITILLNSIDSSSLRRPQSQQILSRLSSHKRIRLVCTADTPSFPFLWDSGYRSSFNFLFHDSSTFVAFAPPEVQPVDDVHELLGRTARRVGGKDGVVFVLRSLPENAKNLFRILVLEVLASMEEDGVEGSAESLGIEYRLLFRKAEEEFVCSNDVGFRTLLKEFHDHQIITSRSDISGTELLCLPFRKEELESILEDLMG